MGRGFISGIIWGAIVGGCIIVIASQMGVQRDLALPQPDATPVEVPAGTEFNQARPESNPVVPSTDATPSGDEVASAALSPAVEADSLPEAETESGLEPVPNVTSPESAAVPETSSAPEIEVADTQDAPSPAQVDADAPASQPAAIALPDVDQGTVPAAPAPAAAPNAPSIADNATAPTTDVAIAPSADESAPERLAPGGLASLDPGASPATPSALPQAESPVVPEEAPVSAEPIEEPVAPEEDTSPQVRTNRLPQIGGPVEEDAEPEVTPEVAALPETDEGALRAHRRGFENTGDRPLLSVVLVHGDQTDLDVVNGLPFPVSIAVDVADPNAADIAKKIRAAGGEVVMIPALPVGGAPSDIEVALQSNISVIPEAVALMDLPEASFQSNRAAVTQIVAAVSESGHALVTFPRGLNTAQKLAERDGVPTGLIFRDLQGTGGGDVHRTLDQAAFRARQQSSVILVGRATPETIAALTEWALGNRAETVSLAPVSAAILGREPAS